MDDIFDRTVVCPICKNSFQSKAVKRSSISVYKRDTDYCSYYRGENPLFYSIFVCNKCGFASFLEDFKSPPEFNPIALNVFKNKISNKCMDLDFGDFRGIEDAIDTYKFAILTHTELCHKKSVLGKICLRLAWLYRYKEDEREILFLKNAKKFFLIAYETEKFSEDTEEELLIMMLIGDISKRIGEYEDSIFWFDKLLKNPQVKRKRHIEINARNSWQEATTLYREENKCHG